MAQLTLSEIILILYEASKQASAHDPKLAAKIDLAIINLQRLESQSKTDPSFDWKKSASEILPLILKILYEYFKDP